MPGFNPFAGMMNGSGSPASSQITNEGIAAAYTNNQREADQTASDVLNHPNDTQYWLGQITNLANNGDVAAMEKLFEYYANLDKEKTARDWTAQREDTAYQRLVADLTKAGISPYILSGATPFASGYQFNSVSGSQMTTAQNNRNTVAASNAKTAEGAIAAIIAAFGLILAHML